MTRQANGRGLLRLSGRLRRKIGAAGLLSGRKTASAEQVEAGLQRGISELVAMQQPTGAFPVYRRAGNKAWNPCHALFSTLTVLLAAGHLLPEVVGRRAIDYILRSRRRDGTWVFGDDMGIPADSDDTACALAVLARHDAGQIRDTDATLLRSFWRSDGGPFRTWNEAGKWADRNRDDAVVNCNIVFALGELGSPATGEEVDAVVALVRASTNGSRYYCSPLTIAYAASRAGLPSELLPPRLFERPGMRKLVLPVAQWLSVAGRWDDKAVAQLLAAQERKGGWATEPWFTGAGRPPPVWGSPAISTALCVEALHGALSVSRFKPAPDAGAGGAVT